MDHVLQEFFRGSEWSHYKSWRRKASRLAAVTVPLEVSSKLIRFSLSRLNTRLRNRFGGEKKYASVGIENIFSESTLVSEQSVIDYFSTRQAPVYLWGKDDVAALKRIALETLAPEVDGLRLKAEKIQRGLFPLVSDIEFDLTAKPNWRGPFDDNEQLFFLNRWYHGVTLAKAYFYTSDERCADCFVDLLQHWNQQNPVDRASPVWESYSVTERINNWIFAYHLLQPSPTFKKRGLLLLLTLLFQHAVYLSENLEVRESHNHLINNGRALYAFGLLFPELEHAATFEEAGWQILTREMKRQFSPDGMLGEQSVHYHLLLMRTYLEVTLLAQRNGRPLDPEYLARLERMFLCANAFTRSDGSIPLIGDFSPDADLRSMVGLLGAGATQFGFDVNRHFSEYGLWYSRPGKTEKMAGSIPASLICLNKSGYAIVRTPELHLTLNCDPRAKIIRHGHADVLGLNLWWRGQDLLIDGGNYSYGKRDWDEYFRGPYSHNTVAVDGLTPYVLPGYQQVLLSPDYSEAEAGIVACREEGPGFYLEAYHTGYKRLADPVAVRRQVWIAVNNWILIRDTVSGDGERTVEVIYNIGSCGFENGVLSSATGEKLAFMDVRSDSDFQIKQFRGQSGRRLRGWRSSSYGVKETATTIIYQIAAVGSVSFDTLIWLNPGSRIEWPDVID